MAIDVLVAPFLIVIVDELDDLPVANFKAHRCGLVVNTYRL
jgi:hypothetical protein